MSDFRSEIEYWRDLWATAEEEGIHPTSQPLQQPGHSGEGTPQDYYYDYLDNESECDLIQEERKMPNPVYPDSIGPDSKTTPPVWADDKIIKEIEALKNKLFKVENKLAEKMGGGKKWTEKAVQPDTDKLMGEIETLRKRIEKVSSTLGIEHEPNPSLYHAPDQKE
jgi:hypothetical protein